MAAGIRTPAPCFAAPVFEAPGSGCRAGRWRHPLGNRGSGGGCTGRAGAPLRSEAVLPALAGACPGVVVEAKARSGIPYEGLSEELQRGGAPPPEIKTIEHVVMGNEILPTTYVEREGRAPGSTTRARSAASSSATDVWWAASWRNRIAACGSWISSSPRPPAPPLPPGPPRRPPARPPPPRHPPARPTPAHRVLSTSSSSSPSLRSGPAVMPAADQAIAADEGHRDQRERREHRGPGDEHTEPGPRPVVAAHVDRPADPGQDQDRDADDRHQQQRVRAHATDKAVVPARRPRLVRCSHGRQGTDPRRRNLVAAATGSALVRVSPLMLATLPFRTLQGVPLPRLGRAWPGKPPGYTLASPSPTEPEVRSRNRRAGADTDWTPGQFASPDPFDLTQIQRGHRNVDPTGLIDRPESTD